MGDPTEEPRPAISCDGTFTTECNWVLFPDFRIEDGVCKFGPQTQPIFQIMLCPSDLVAGQTYHIEFDMLEADFEADDALYMYVSFEPLSFAGPFREVGHYSFFLTCLETGYDFRLRVESNWLRDTTFVIDNLFVTNATSDLAFTKGLMPIPGGKNEVLTIDSEKANILLAHWRDKSNILIEME